MTLSALESEGNPVCRVTWPDDVGPLWGGTYGHAKIERGAPGAITADGKRHAL